MVLTRTLETERRRRIAVAGPFIARALQGRIRTRIAKRGIRLRATMAFILNPFQADIDLSNKEDKKLFEKGCEGLAKEDKFDGKREKYTTFMKLMKVAIEGVKLMDTLVLGTTYDATVTAPRPPKTSVNLFETNAVTDDEVSSHCNLVWSDSVFGADTPQYFTTFKTLPTDTAWLNELRNQRKIRHVMLGNKLWNSFTSHFQLEILP